MNNKQKIKINKSTLGIAGEYYVAAELGRRNVYAQLTLGNQKRTDLLIFSEQTDKVLKIEVKNKQGREWPSCKGIYKPHSFIVFVDFKDLGPAERPAFYILSTRDWRKVADQKKHYYLSKNPNKKITIDSQNVMVHWSELTKAGQPYRGCGVVPADIEGYKEKWENILKSLND